MHIENYEIIQNSTGNMIAINYDPALNLQNLKEIYIGKQLNFKTQDGETITLPKMDDEIAKQIKKHRTILIVTFKANEMFDAVEVKVLR